MESTIMQPSLVGEYQRTSIGCAVSLSMGLFSLFWQVAIKSWSYCFPCYYTVKPPWLF